MAQTRINDFFRSAPSPVNKIKGGKPSSASSRLNRNKTANLSSGQSYNEAANSLLDDERSSASRAEGSNRSYHEHVNSNNPYRHITDFAPQNDNSNNHRPISILGANNSRRNSTASNMEGIPTQTPQTGFNAFNPIGIGRGRDTFSNMRNFLRQAPRPMVGGNDNMDNDYYDGVNDDENYHRNNGGGNVPPQEHIPNMIPQLPAEQAAKIDQENAHSIQGMLDHVINNGEFSNDAAILDHLQALLKPDGKLQLHQLRSNQPINGFDGKKWAEFTDHDKEQLKSDLKAQQMPANEFIKQENIKSIHDSTAKSIIDERISSLLQFAQTAMRLIGQFHRVIDNGI